MRIYGVSSLFTAIAISIFVFSLPNQALAGSPLTEQDVRAFVQKTTDMTSAHALSEHDASDIESYLDQHLHEDSRFKSTMTYSIPGHEKQKNALSLDKKEYIESILKAPDTVGDDFEQDIEITNVTISKNGKFATVKTQSRESGAMHLPTGESVPIDGVSKCTQTLTRGSHGLIQMYSAQCETDIEFSDMGF